MTVENPDNGFDIVLGNPPWERIKLQEKEFFDQRAPEIAGAPNAAARRRMITQLPQTDPALFQEFQDAKRRAEGISTLVRNTGRYPLCGRGDINTYSIFAELKRNLLNPNGRVGCIVPSGIATDDTTKYFFQDLMDTGSLVSLYSFENEEFIFPAVHHATKFCLLSMAAPESISQRAVDFVFFARQVEHLTEPERHFTLTADDIALLNPNTRTCPIFRRKQDAELTKYIYRRVPVLIREARDRQPEENPWGIKFATMFHMANDSKLFRTKEQLESDGFTLDGNIFRKNTAEYLPLYEAKMIHHFDHRWGTYDGQTPAQARQGKLPEFTTQMHADPSLYAIPRYWIKKENVKSSKMAATPATIGFRRITGATVLRTFVVTIVPAVGHGDSIFLLNLDSSVGQTCVSSALASFMFDYVTRKKMGGLNMSFYIVQQLPLHAPSTFKDRCPWLTENHLQDWLAPRVLELMYTAWDLEAFALDCDYSGPPFRWDEDRRFLLRCELDAAYFHLYLGALAGWGTDSPELRDMVPTPRDAVGYIMDTFPIVKRKDIKSTEIKNEVGAITTEGTYITKDTILKIYDEMQHAIDSGRPYQTRLDPPPGPPIDEAGNFIPMTEWDTANWPPHIHPPKKEE